MKTSCKIIEDLLPMYHDGICSEESSALIEEHLRECPNCSQILASLRGEIQLEKDMPADDLKPLEEIQQQIEQTKQNPYRRIFTKDGVTQIGKILFYKTDGPTVADETDKNRYKNSAIAQIQNEMTDEEQLLVNDLCMANKLSADSWLIKDGSLQYNPRFSNIDQAQWNNMRANYEYVVGVSKSFDPDLLKNHEGKKLSQIIASLKPFERTKAYKYISQHSNGMTFAVWYLRLRNSNFRETHFSDIVKCEMLLLNPHTPISTSTIDAISANLIREAYPVCFGADTRWANHLYPIYLTETFCKSHYIDNNIFLSLF